MGISRVFAKNVGNKIGNKLFAAFVLIVALTILPIAHHVLDSVNTFGNYSTRINKEQIRNQAISYLTRLCDEQGARHEEYFAKFSAVVHLLATQASNIYQDLSAYATMTGEPAPLHFQEENRMYITGPGEPVVSLYWGASSLSADTLLETAALRHLESSMMEAEKVLPEALATHVITTSGIGKYYTKNPQARDAVHQLPVATEFDLRNGAPLTVFTESEEGQKGVRWTKIYKDDVIDGLVVTASGPIVDGTGHLRGIVGIDVPLTTLVDTILDAGDLEQQGDSRVLLSFLLGASGEIIAFPVKFLSLFGLPFLPEKMEHSKDMLDCKLDQSTNPQVQKMVARILAKESGVETVLLGEENHLVASQTLSVHGWKLVMVAREADLVSSAEKTRHALDKMIVSLKTRFVFYSLCITLIILCLSYLAVRNFVAPLQKLALLAERVGEGDLSQKSDLERGDELGALATSMNTMIDGLVSAETMKKQYFHRLEDGIKNRTAQLQRNNQKLSAMMSDVHLESEKNRKLSNALRERERQLIATMEASLAGLCIVQGNRFKYVNTAIVKMFGYSKIELINKMGPIDLIAPEYKVEVMERMSLQEERLYRRTDQPHHVQCLRKNGEVFDVEVDGSYIPWKGVPASVGTMIDISEHVRAQKKILVKEKHLQGLLQEKDLLLREVYHRTKNNMLVIISMLALQMEEIEDKAAKKIFEEMEHRIRAMALVHENLYQSESLIEINLGEYLAKLARTQVEHMTFSNQIEVRADYCQVTVPFDKAVPLGLVVSELITNSVKHAFPAGKKGIIHIQLAVKKGVYYLVVEDNGTGLPTEIDVENATSFGLQITSSMVVKQLGGTLAVDRSRGTAFHITFKDRT